MTVTWVGWKNLIDFNQKEGMSCKLTPHAAVRGIETTTKKNFRASYIFGQQNIIKTVENKLMCV